MSVVFKLVVGIPKGVASDSFRVVAKKKDKMVFRIKIYYFKMVLELDTFIVLLIL